MLELTGKVLAENPDIYTFWNVRKETLLKIKIERLIFMSILFFFHD